jgi:hypothetical protein
MAVTLTEEQLTAIKCNDISILTLPNGKELLVLLCETKADSNLLADIINNNAFNLGISIEADGRYGLSIEFIDSEIFLKLVTPRTEINYSPVKKLKNNGIAFITAGVRVGKNIEYNHKMLRLGEINIGESFSQAKSIHFAIQDGGKGPSVVVLVYENWEHISKADAMEAFNELALRSKGNPKLEIIADGSLVKLKIWDILIDLEVKIEGLEYEPTNLDEFAKHTDPLHSFAFALGFPPPGDGSTALAAGKDGPQFVTIKGYVLKTN